MAEVENITAKVYSSHIDELKTSLLKVERDNALIDDVLQEAFIKFYLNINRGKTIINSKGWIYRVAQNLLIDHFRQEKKRIDPIGVQCSEEKGAHGPEDCLRGIIANLSPKYKNAIYLTDIKGIPQTESAKRLRVSLSTFKSHVQRGRKLITQGYIECCDYSIDENGLLKRKSKDWKECKVCSKNI